MTPLHREALTRELALGRDRMRAGAWAEALVHLERAHILGQRHLGPHLRTHWLMLRVELLRRAPLAAVGQLVRMVLAVPGTPLGRLPIGNTGGSDVNMFTPMPIPPDLARLMQDPPSAPRG